MASSPHPPDTAVGEHRPALGRRWLMRLTAAVLIPALILGAAELLLRLADYGYSPRFFKKVTIDGETEVFVNDPFTRRFFPPALARSALPQRFSAHKAPDTYRIFVFGESAANGDPDPAYSFGRHLEILLRERFPGTRFEVICTAITAINSHAIVPIARECADLDGDLWIIYMGNNEMVGTFGAGTVFGAQAPPLFLARLALAVKSTRFGQWMAHLSSSLGGQSGAPETWGGIGMFSQNLLRPDDPGRLRVYQNFQGNLESILRAGTRAQVPVLLSTVASNLQDCAPFASLHARDLTAPELAAWETAFAQGKALETAGAYADALSAYAHCAQMDASFAELQFRIGHCHRSLAQWNQAKTAFVQARDLDALVVRADSRINEIIRAAARDFHRKGVTLVDAAARLGEGAPGGVAGRGLFYEHVHYTVPGNYQLARSFAEVIAPSLPPAIRAHDQKNWTRPGACQRQLALTLWDQKRLWREMYDRLSVPPFTQQATNSADLAYFQAQADKVGKRMNPALDRRIYEWALAADPDDYLLHSHFGKFLQEHGALPEAINHLQWVCDRFPDFAGGPQELGIALFLDHRYSEAKKSFERVLDIRPGYANARKALELIQTETPEAERGP